MTKILFILKRKEDFNPKTDNHIGLSTGLYNSATFMHEMLLGEGIDSNLEVVIDNNDIDRNVTKYKPTHVIIEALWVVPTKFAILQKLHPTVKWIVRLHSEMPFLANEGIAMGWVAEYCNYKNVYVGVNAPRMMEEMATYLRIKHGRPTDKLIYFPNYYPVTYKDKKYDLSKKDIVSIGCFGAVRPLKNHMVQAIAAIKFADKIGKKLKFHINGNRVEMKGEPILHNLRGMFEQLSHLGHELIGHEWVPREGFLKICEQMDIGLQVSFSETFNIVGADIVSQGVPIVACSEIPWSYPKYNAVPTESDDIYHKLLLVHENPRDNVVYNQHGIAKYSENTKDIWLEYFRKG